MGTWSGELGNRRSRCSRLDAIIRPAGPAGYSVGTARSDGGFADEALAWCSAASRSGWQVCQLYDLACDVHLRREESLRLETLSDRERRSRLCPFREEPIRPEVSGFLPLKAGGVRWLGHDADPG